MCDHYFDTESRYPARCRAEATTTVRISLRHGEQVFTRQLCESCARTEMQINLWGASVGHSAEIV